MKNFLALSLSFLSLAALSACNTEDKEKYTRGVEIETVPSGMEIIVDGLKVGKAPLTLEVETTEGGCFVRKTVVTALPSVANLNTHIKTFPAFRPENESVSEVPEKITFNMDKKPDADDAVVIEK